MRRERVMRFSVRTTALGTMLVVSTDVGVCALEFPEGGDEGVLSALEESGRRFSRRFSGEVRFVEESDAFQESAVRYVESVLSGEDCPCDIRPLDLVGTEFQLRVWRELLCVAKGEVIAYSELARRVGVVGGSRAVGNAVGANPVAVIVPCHRVVRADGSVGGYRWGEWRKRALLAAENR